MVALSFLSPIQFANSLSVAVSCCYTLDRVMRKDFMRRSQQQKHEFHPTKPPSKAVHKTGSKVLVSIQIAKRAFVECSFEELACGSRLV